MLVVRKSASHGLGLFTKNDIPQGSVISLTNVDTGRGINHSCFPNVLNFGPEYYDTLIATRDIKKNEEIVLDYRLWNVKLHFVCNCPLCKELRNDQQNNGLCI